MTEPDEIDASNRVAADGIVAYPRFMARRALRNASAAPYSQPGYRMDGGRCA